MSGLAGNCSPLFDQAQVAGAEGIDNEPRQHHDTESADDSLQPLLIVAEHDMIYQQLRRDRRYQRKQLGHDE